MSSERSLMENVLIFEDENEHQLFNYYVETHWCNKVSAKLYSVPKKDD
ncbi:hypothetical protein ACTNC9_12085 [Catenibacterium mitsuokai]